ncbi:NADH-quinone oxidoreductase subunit L [Pinisolibacter aquiterrae]|uniref:NADH-quinone oxidoreductase subunit 5 family protein n=1 Tax=Pinisolibacter aquiterrae TaxID=2815579 RepID=UPI001C3E5F6E|nr:NADH-quinone oxidoreductase subunit L [Pinisolibacter aquiterrae]MBV5263736.1 NADH-quinone oxidoreductase subunit L [Pinisolibacter aquiterrae]MCC8235066.1 NADH-quinone oxidoreductase subunit L [Pinisolibacter aquiterrae]
MDPVTLPVLALLAGAGLQLVLAPWLSPLAKGRLAALAAALAFAAALALLPATMHGDVLTATLTPVWDADTAVTFRVDGLAALFTLMGTAAGTAILIFSIRYMADEPQGLTRFYTIMLVFVAGLLVLGSAADLLIAYVAWEVIGLCSYTLVGFWYRQKAAVDGARKVLVITHLAGYGFLVAIVLLQLRTGTLDWADPKLAAGFTTGVAALMIVSAMAKSVMFPLHTWIPEAMNAPTPVSALLHSACYVKAGVYLIARMYSIGPWTPELGGPLAIVASVTILVGVIFALKQTDLKRLLAFHTVSQLGYIVGGLAIGTAWGIAAGLFYTLSHALFKGTLFMVAGSVQHATGTRDLTRLGGLSSVMPWTTKIWIVAAAAIAGVPLTNGFVAKWLLFGAALDKGWLFLLAAGWIGSILTAFSFLKATVNVFYGAMPVELARAQARHELHEASPSMLIGMGLMAAGCVVFGLAPQLMMDAIVAPAVAGLGFTPDVATSWGGIATGRGAIGLTVGATLVAAALAMGWIVWRLADAPTRATVAVFTGGEPLPAGDRPGAVDFAGMAEDAFHPVYGVDPDPLWLGIWSRAGRVATGTRNAFAPLLERRPALLILLATLAVAATLALG